MSNELELKKELEILSEIILSEDEEKYFHILSKSDFCTEYGIKLFSIIEEVYREYSKLDPVIVLLKTKSEDSDFNSFVKLALESSCRCVNLYDRVKLFKSNSIEKRFKDQVIGLSFENEISINAIKELIHKTESEDNLETNSLEKSKKLLLKVKNELDTFKRYSFSGFDKLDSNVGGFETGSVIIIGARPGCGKTTFALNFALQNAELGHKILFFSLEMKPELIVEKALSITHEYPIRRFHRNITEEDKQRLINVNDEFISNIIVEHDTRAIENIQFQVMKEKPSIVIIDYIQIVDSLQNFKDDRTRINYISRVIKGFSSKCGCTTIILSQLNRSTSETGAPRATDLKESGALEQEGDYIILLDNPYAKNQKGQAGLVSLHLVKNKYSSLFTEYLDFNLPIQKFTESDIPFEYEC